MAEQHSAEQVLPSATSQRGGRQNQQRGHGRRRGRGRGGSGQPSEPSASANRDIVSQGESVHQGASVGQRGLSEATSRHIGASRRSRAGRQAVAHRGSSKPDGQPIRRQFGGHLTSTPSEHLSSEILATLSGNAPEFVPGQALQTRGQPKQHNRPLPRQPKSIANDLATRIHEDIDSRNYECAICTDDVVRNSQVWSCILCWNVVHMKCVKKWHGNQRQGELQSPEPQSEPFWRCPGCNSRLTDEPGTYHCWCGKDINPKPSSSALPPHSCGQTCFKPRPTCPHPCSLQCHAGPCPPCGLMGPAQSCFCGKNSSRKLCRETNYEHGWGCNEPCGDLMPCGEHSCPKPCHSGLCGDCDTTVNAKCYCGRIEKSKPCFELEEIQQSFDAVQKTWYKAMFNCEQPCDRSYDCGIHRCAELCHPQDEQEPHCPYSPDVILQCPCGKTAISDLLNQPRDSCESVIPHCDRVCGKLLPCGHACKAKCHTGDCGFCREAMEVSCRCGRTQNESICHQGNIQPPLCRRMCQAQLNCGRHKCGEHCCPGEKKAMERQAAKRKHKLPGQATAIEAEHICIRTCERSLKCGSHTCEQMCHRGACGSCPEAIFSEISCNCGRTVLQPPQPCGTRAPDCRYPCTRSPTCGHPRVEHSCHSDEAPCPKCPFLVEKWCGCGKEKLQSQPCHLQAAHCGRPCGKILNCKLHLCRRLCHKPGECETTSDANNHCKQLCGKTKMFCEHTCQNTCHGNTPCNENSSCTAKATVSCPCGQHVQEVRCLASSTNPEPVRPKLSCDDECLRLERNRRLAAALNIDPTTHKDEHVPYSETTLRLYKESITWAETQEREFRVFSQSPTEIRLRYKPMAKPQRQFLHVLAEDYGLESKSEDVEPYRYVIVFKGPRFVAAPSKTLALCAKIRAEQAAQTAAAAAASTTAAPPLTLSDEPFNAFILTGPKFGLTIDEVESTMKAIWIQVPSLRFDVEFLPSDEVLLKATAHYSAFLSTEALEQTLVDLKSQLLDTVQQSKLAAGILLCHSDSKHRVLRRENLAKQDASGWSAVASKAAWKKESAPMGEPDKPVTRRLLGLKKKKVEAKSEKPWSAIEGDVEC